MYFVSYWFNFLWQSWSRIHNFLYNSYTLNICSLVFFCLKFVSSITITTPNFTLLKDRSVLQVGYLQVLEAAVKDGNDFFHFPYLTPSPLPSSCSDLFTVILMGEVTLKKTKMEQSFW